MVIQASLSDPVLSQILNHICIHRVVKLLLTVMIDQNSEQSYKTLRCNRVMHYFLVQMALGPTTTCHWHKDSLGHNSLLKPLLKIVVFVTLNSSETF